MRKLTREEMMAVSGGEGCYWDVYGNFLYCDPPPPPPPPGCGWYWEPYTQTWQWHC